MTTKAGEGFFAGDSNTNVVSSEKPDSYSDEQEIIRKIREVSMNSDDFDAMVQRYMNQ